MKRPAFGLFGRLELAVYGAPCKVIASYIDEWACLLSDKFKIGFADESHTQQQELPCVLAVNYSTNVAIEHVSLAGEGSDFDKRTLFDKTDLVFVNGNHFIAARQIVIIHPDKPLENKLEKLTDVVLVLLSPGQDLPEYIKPLVKEKAVPIFKIENKNEIAGFLFEFISRNAAPVKGLVLAGGQSTRMHTDKGAIAYHGKSQRAHSFELLAGLVDDVFISGNEGEGFPLVPDAFIGLGPFGGILSAMQQDPDAAWLTIACDLPYLTAETLRYLLDSRDPSKVATAFLDSEGKFPEPLITIWEPRAYPRMLQFLSQGYSCPRKVLINSDIKSITAPNAAEFKNINYPAERDEALRFFGSL